MGILRENFWVFLVAGMVFCSAMIAFIYLLINKCITEMAKKHMTISHQNSNDKFPSEPYQYHPKDERPPLPPRNQFLPPSNSLSYEDIENLPDYLEVNGNSTPPPYQPNNTASSPEISDQENASYDDVVMPGYVSEDYDDVG